MCYNTVYLFATDFHRKYTAVEKTGTCILVSESALRLSTIFVYFAGQAGLEEFCVT
jgi:hypothetical protein